MPKAATPIAEPPAAPVPVPTAVESDFDGDPDTVAILRAAGGGAVETVIGLLRRRPELVRVRAISDGTSALHHAAMTGELEVAKVLVRGGADVNARDKRQMSPLHVAAGHCEMSQQHIAAGYGDRTAFMQWLLDHGAIVATPSSEGTALHIAAMEGCLQNAKALVRRGASVHAIDNTYGSVLAAAAFGRERFAGNRQARIRSWSPEQLYDFLRSRGAKE